MLANLGDLGPRGKWRYTHLHIRILGKALRSWCMKKIALNIPDILKYFKNLEQVQGILDLGQFAVRCPWRVWGLYSQLHKGQRVALDSPLVLLSPYKLRRLLTLITLLCVYISLLHSFQREKNPRASPLKTPVDWWCSFLQGSWSVPIRLFSQRNKHGLHQCK